MLKGQLDVDIEFMGGTIIFIALAVIMFVEVMVPLLGADWTLITSDKEIRSVIFANLARAHFLNETGNGKGDIAYDKLEAQTGKGLAGPGLSGNYISIKSLVSSDSWEE